MKAKKLTVIAVLAMALVMMMACGLVSQVESIKLVNPLEASYDVNPNGVDVSNLMVEIKIAGSEPMTWPLNDTRLTVEGLVNGKLDTATPGVKTIKISYMGVSITATYVVVGETTSENVWTVENNELLAAINGTDNEIDLKGATIDLSANQWPATKLTRELTIKNGTIKGLTMTNDVAFGNLSQKRLNSGAGLIGWVSTNGKLTVENVVFEDVVIEQTSQKQGDECKDFGVVVGCMNGSNSSVDLTSVIVKNATIKGNGRLGGLVGQVSHETASITITSCEVNATLIGHNPITETGAEGEADKIGGLVGQVDGKSTCDFTGNTVTVIINGTRDCGGIVGYVSGKANVTIKNNTVTAKSIIALSVEGGMNASKGKRHAGGIIGTWSLSDVEPKLVFEGNQVLTTNILTNANYASASSRGINVGGFRYSYDTVPEVLLEGNEI